MNKEINEENWTLPQPTIPALIDIQPMKATIKNGKIMAEILADEQSTILPMVERFY